MPSVEIPEEVLSQLQTLKRDPYANQRVTFEPWMDKVLLECWMDRNYRQSDIAKKVLGRGEHQCRRRYHELMKEKQRAEQADKRESTPGDDSRTTEGMQRGRYQTPPIYRESDTEGAS